MNTNQRSAEDSQPPIIESIHSRHPAYDQQLRPEGYPQDTGHEQIEADQGGEAVAVGRLANDVVLGNERHGDAEHHDSL